MPRVSTYRTVAALGVLSLATSAAARPEPAGFIDTFGGLPPAPATLDGVESVPTTTFGFDGAFGPFSWLALGPDWITPEGVGGVGNALRLRVAQTNTQQPDVYANAIVTWPFEDSIRARHTEPLRLSVDLYLPAYGERFGVYWYTTGPPEPPWVGLRRHSGMSVGGSLNGPDVIRVLAVGSPQIQYYWHDGAFVGSAPAGFSVGDRPRMPLNTWVRFIVEGGFDRYRKFYVDYLDGQGEFLIYADFNPFFGLSMPMVNEVAFGSGRQVLGAQAWFDNHTVIGARRPAATPPLTCDYHDPLDWVFEGPLNYTVQSRWQGALIHEGACSEFLGQNYIGASAPFTIPNQFLEAIRTDVPHVDAVSTGAWRACVDFTHLHSNVGVRLISPTSSAADNAAARVFIGHNPDPDAPGSQWDDFVYVQTNPEFSPLNTDAGPPADYVPVIGVDVVSTGAKWPRNPALGWATLCVEVNEKSELRVFINDDHVYTGVAFDTAINAMAFEGHPGAGASNLRLICANACPGDANGDGVVDFTDLGAVLAAFGESGDGLPGDLNGDGVVDFADLGLVLAAFGQSCTK